MCNHGSVSLGLQRAVRVLLVQPWTIDAAPIENALREAGVDAALARADFEASLQAALSHDQFDVVIFDRATSELTREAVETCTRAHGRGVPVIAFDDPAQLAAEVLRVIGPRRH